MDERIEHLKEDGDAVKKAMDTNRTKLDAKNFKQAKYDSFTAAQLNLDLKDKEQSKAEELAISATTEKNNTKQEAADLINNLNLTVKSAVGNDKYTLKMFKVDEPITGGYNGIIDRCEYLGGIDEANLNILFDNGMTQEAFETIKAMPEKLRNANSSQNAAKKKQKAATEVRDAAGKAFKSEINKIRNFVKANFPKDKEMLIAFEPVPKDGGSKGGDSETTTPPQNPPA